MSSSADVITIISTSKICSQKKRILFKNIHFKNDYRVKISIKLKKYI